jgi:CheY-like chemotaxis protein
VAGLSVIIAEDVDELRALLAQVVTEMGYEVATAATGREAAKLLRSAPCDLLITDVLMPDGDGVELLTELRRTEGMVRILAISGGGMSLDPGYCLTMARALGAHATLAKPFAPWQLRTAIHTALGDRAKT